MMRTIYTSTTARQVQEIYHQIHDLQLSPDADQETRERVDQSIQNIISRVRDNMLTQDTGWLPLGANIAEAEDVHAFSYRNKTELKKGHAFWTETWLPEELDKDDKEEVNKQVLTALNSLLGLLCNGITQTSDAAIAYPLATLEENLAQTDVRIKQELFNNLGKIRETETDFNQKTLLERKRSILRSFMVEPMSATASTSTSDITAEAVSALTQTLTNIFNRRTCITLIEDTMPDMLQNGTYNFVDLLGYCCYSLQQDKSGDYLDPEKIDTLVGLLAESAQAYANNASCAAGIVERCQRDGYIIAQSSARSQSHQTEQEVLENILTQVREASVGNKLTATSNEPQPLLGLLMMDALLRDSGVTSWPITNPEENTKKIQTISDELRDETFAHLDQRIEDNTALATELDNETKQITAEVLLITLLQTDDHTTSNVYIERLYEKDRDVRKQLLENLPEEKENCAQWLEENRDTVLPQLLGNIRRKLIQTQQRLIEKHEHTSASATNLDEKIKFLEGKVTILTAISNHTSREHSTKKLTAPPESLTEKNDNTASNRFNEDEKTALSKLIQVSTQYSMYTQRKLRELRLENTKTQEQRTRLSDILSSPFSKKGSANKFESKTQEALTDPEPTPVIAPSTVSEVLLIVDKIAAGKTTIDLSKISPESRTALKKAQESIVGMMAHIENSENIDEKIDWMGNFQARISDHKKNFFQILQEVGFTKESSDVLIQTCCLTNVSDRSLSHQNYVTLIEHWQMIMTQAIGYLDDSTNQEDLGKHPVLTTPTQACYQEAMQKQWCQPIIDSLDRLLEQDANQNFLYAAPLAEYLSKNDQNLTFPAVCRDLEQADKILDFLQDDSIIAYLMQHNATPAKQRIAFFNCIMGNDLVIERHLERFFALQDQENLTLETTVIIESHDHNLLARLGTSLKKLSNQESTDKAHVTKIALYCLFVITKQQFSSFSVIPVIDLMRAIVSILEEHNPGALSMLTTPDESSGKTPFQKAMEEKNIVLVLALFDFLKERNPEGLIYPDVLHKAVTLPVRRNIDTLIDTIIEISPDCLIIKNSNGMTPLAQAIQDKKFGFIESLSEACKNRYPDELIHNFDNLFDLILQNGRKRSVQTLTKVLHAIQETRPEKLEEIIESKREILRAIQNTQGKRYIGIEEIFDTLLDKRTNTASVSASSPRSGVSAMGLFAQDPKHTSALTSASKDKKPEDPSEKSKQHPHI